MLQNFKKENNIYSLRKFHAWLVFNFMIHFHKNLDFFKSAALQDSCIFWFEWVPTISIPYIYNQRINFSKI